MATSIIENGGHSPAANGRPAGNRNPNFANMKSDMLYHLGLNSGTQDLQEMFGDVKVSHRKSANSSQSTFQQLGTAFKVDSPVLQPDLCKIYTIISV